MKGRQLVVAELRNGQDRQARTGKRASTRRFIGEKKSILCINLFMHLHWIGVTVNDDFPDRRGFRKSEATFGPNDART